MALTCNCPLGAALADIPISTCPEGFGQVQKVAFQRLYNNGVKNKITAPTTLASWTALLSAVNGTKVTISPFINGPTTEAGAARTYGSGNEVLGGIPINIGREATTFTSNLLQQPADIIKVLKDYQCEQVGVYLFDENGKIGCLCDDLDSPTEYYPIPIHSLFVGDRTLGGYESLDMNVLSWSFAPNWSDMLVKVSPTDFNPLYDLATPVAATTTSGS